MRLFLLLAIGVSLNAAIVSSSFDTDAEGWTALTADPFSNGIPVYESSVPVLYNATGGNPAGYISVTDPDHVDIFFVAPAVYRSLLSGGAGIGAILSYDLLYNDSALTWNGPDIVIKGGGKTLVYDGDIPPIGTTWSTLGVFINPGPEWYVGRQGIHGGTLATMQDFIDVFQNVTDLWILAEFTNGITEVTGLDNFTAITFDDDPAGDPPGDPVPEPSTFIMMLMAGAGVSYWRRRSA